jgi:hypothetical protein
MNMRSNLIVVSVGLLLAAVFSPPRTAATNLLVDGEFNGVPPLNTLATVFGPPFITGQWGAENGAIVGVDGGVTPLTARTMLAEYSPAGGYTQTMQATDVSADPALSTYTLSAYFNANVNLAAAQAYVNLSFYDASYNPVGSPVSSGLTLDSSPATWEPISLTLTEPANTKYIVSQVLYLESSLVDSTGATWPGYVDSASLVLVPEPSTPILLGLSALGFAVRVGRRRV